jgi:hypothetical protein
VIFFRQRVSWVRADSVVALFFNLSITSVIAR